MKKKYFIVFLISIIFSTITGKGFYGFGADYYQAYHLPNLRIGGLTDRLGWIISTLTIGNFKLGVYITSFALSFSTGMLLITTHGRYLNKNALWIFYLSYIALLHTWPIIQSTSNAMRQGLSMSLLFISLHFLLTKKYFNYIIALILVALLHKSGILFASMLLASSFYFTITKNLLFSDKLINKLYLTSWLVILPLFYLLTDMYFNNDEPSVIISGDFRLPFLIINILYIVFYAKYLLVKSDAIDRLLLASSFVLPVFLIKGFNWEYERFNMIIIVLYMISFSRLFIASQRNISLFLAVILLLVLTFITGMYTSLK
jgi:hypothetical protein